MEEEELDEFTDEQLSALDRMVENLPKNYHSSPMRNDNARNEIVLKRGRTSSFDGLTDEQMAAIDNEVENVHKRFSPKRDRTNLIESSSIQLQEELADFGELTETQFNSLDREVEQFNTKQQNDQQQRLQQQHPNENERPTHTNTITASQLELARAVFDDDDDNEPSFDQLECLRSRFKHSGFRDKQWEIIRALMIEKRDVCAVMATGYGKSLCFQVQFSDSFGYLQKLQLIFVKMFVCFFQ